ncbi:hypothetical protein [Dysgonomonas sp. UBA7710]|uniref:hypothetical protein n=1 Tax=Dysgonomonas sp. UBA7710 TaxID=1946428 RepID=UPI0025BE82E7|nr:hypothetical protein [Dysgonomonas sp. UBA7710]
MKKNILIVLSLIITTITYAQDQTVNGNLLQQLNNQWLSPAKLQLGRSNSSIVENKAVIGVTNGNLHVDSYPGYALCLNYYQKDSNSGNKGLTISPSGNVGIGTHSPRSRLDVSDSSQNTLKSVLARLDEGNSAGDGTYLGVKSYYTQVKQGENSEGNVKSFSLEHKFYGQINSSINFYRGGSQIGGSLGISVYDGREIARFFNWGLNLAGTIRSKEVKIEATGWSDFVFNKNYDLPKLSEVEKHINEKQHLPGIPSEKEVLENGISVGEMQAKLLQKIEELTLYVITQDKRIKALEEENHTLKSY